MSYIDIFNQRNEDYGSSIRDIRINSTKAKIVGSFYNNPSYYNILLLTPFSPLTSTQSDVWITDDSDTKSQKIVTAIPGQSVNVGYLYFWNNEYWLTVQNDHQLGDMYDRGTMIRCYSSIKWLDENGDIRESWFCFKSDSATNFGITDGKVIIMPNERRNITIQNNEWSRKIEKDKRFILDGRGWRVTSVDRLIDGIINLTLEEGFYNKDTDNMDLRIADYYENIHSYSIKILNGESAVASVGDALQLSIDAKDMKNGSVVSTNLPITYSSSNEAVATVSESGVVEMLTDGEVTITASLTDHPSIHTSILLSISNVITNNYSIAITGADICKVTQSQSYSVVIYNNSIPDNTKTVLWSLVNDASDSFTDLAQITTQTGNSCVIKGLKYLSPQTTSFVRLVATCGELSLSVNKRIQIKSVY